MSLLKVILNTGTQIYCSDLKILQRQNFIILKCEDRLEEAFNVGIVDANFEPAEANRLRRHNILNYN